MEWWSPSASSLLAAGSWSFWKLLLPGNLYSSSTCWLNQALVGSEPSLNPGQSEFFPGPVTWMSVSPPNSCVYILTLQDDGLGWGKLWDRISPESRALTDGINTLIREIPQSSVATCTKWGHKERSETLKNVTPLAPWSWTFSLQNCKKSISVVYESPSLWPLVTVARMD